MGNWKRPDIQKRLAKPEDGQSLVETVLMMPFLLLVLLNAMNFGYFFLMTLNITASPRSGVEYSIMGFETPSAESLPASGPAGGATGPLTVTYLAQQDMTGAIYNPTGASVKVCSLTNLSSGSGVNGTGQNQKTNCVTCTGTTCGSVDPSGTGVDADPEAPSFLLNRVDVTYTFTPLIPGKHFNLAFIAAPICTASGSSCTFHRFAEMRAMN